jgi:hypothetical protein
MANCRFGRMNLGLTALAASALVLATFGGVGTALAADRMVLAENFTATS